MGYYAVMVVKYVDLVLEEERVRLLDYTIKIIEP